MDDVIDAFALALARLTVGRPRHDTAALFEAARRHPARTEVRDAIRDNTFDASWLSRLDRDSVETAGGLLGVDDATETINPYLGVGEADEPDPGMLADLHRRYWRTQRLSTDDDLIVMPRPRLYQEPTLSPGEHFGNLLPVPGEHSKGVRLVGWRGPARLGFVPDAVVAFATLPLLRHDGIAFERRDAGGQTWYAAVPDGEALADRTGSALAELDKSGAHIGIVPEATLDDEVLRAWQRAMLSTDGSGNLRFVLVGTGAVDETRAEQPPNRAVMLDRLNGERVFDQDKLNGYAMTFDDLDSWGVGRRLRAAARPALS